jgi:integrase/recombinase XerD
MKLHDVIRDYLVGHIDLNSTQRYLTMTPALLQQACGRFERYAMAGGTDA